MEIPEAFAAPYMQRAVVEVFLICTAAAAVGVHVVLRRAAFLAEALQHTVFPGVVIAYMAGFSLLLGATAAAVVSLLILALAAVRRSVDTDALTAVILTGFIGLGVLLVSRRPSYQHDLTSLLFGRLLSVDWSIVQQTAVMAVLVVGALVLFHKELIFEGFDVEGFAAVGYRPTAIDSIFRLAVVAVVVAAVQAVGTVLLIAFFVTPALIARQLSSRLIVIFVLAVAISVLSGVGGLWLSYWLSVDHDIAAAPAATIVLLLSAGFVVASIGKFVFTRMRATAERARA